MTRRRKAQPPPAVPPESGAAGDAASALPVKSDGEQAQQAPPAPSAPAPKTPGKGHKQAASTRKKRPGPPAEPNAAAATQAAPSKVTPPKVAAEPQRCQKCNAALGIRRTPGSPYCRMCEWEQGLSPKTQARRAENAVMRDLAGDLIPAIARGTERQRVWALDIATEIITRMPSWLWKAVKEEVTQAGLGHNLGEAGFWIDHRDMGFYGFLAILLLRCMKRQPEERRLPARLLAVMLYISPAGEIAESPLLDEMLDAHPVTDKDTARALMGRYPFPLHIWGSIAAEGLTRLDPDADASDWIVQATVPLTAPVVNRCRRIPCEQVATCGPLIVLTTDHQWLFVSAATWQEHDNTYAVTLLGGGSRTVRADDVETCFFMGADDA